MQKQQQQQQHKHLNKIYTQTNKTMNDFQVAFSISSITPSDTSGYIVRLRPNMRIDGFVSAGLGMTFGGQSRRFPSHIVQQIADLLKNPEIQKVCSVSCITPYYAWNPVVSAVDFEIRDFVQYDEMNITPILIPIPIPPNPQLQQNLKLKLHEKEIIDERRKIALQRG